MVSAQVLLLGLALVLLMTGIVSVGLVRSTTPRFAAWGRRLSFLVLIALGFSGVFAACHCAKGLSYLGILAGMLVVAMLWDSPAPALERQESA